jgi:hypothetical protein
MSVSTLVTHDEIDFNASAAFINVGGMVSSSATATPIACTASK